MPKISTINITRFTAALCAFFAAGTVGGRAVYAAEDGPGFPQLDTSTYASQVFWLFVSFVTMYFIMSRIALPRIAHVMELREAQKRSDLTEAERLNAEAEEALDEYKQLMAKVQDDTREILGKAGQEISEMQAKRHAELQAEMQEKLVKTEKSVQKAIDEALDGLTIYATELTQQASGKLGGVKPANDETAKAVKSLWKKTKTA
ncbi:MAG: hypothetical protein EA357_09065 [Micavibrio sp.]|jgi:F-type H+-transporting ATPase subunit b|nr:MAG: hypothetical protein EA357_09065 [Micavibrio sp.]